jgi:hypothetical protein
MISPLTGRFDTRAVLGRLLFMSLSRESALLAILTGEPTSTSEIYDRVGYAALTRLGLVSYHAFRAELEKLSAAGLLERRPGDDGSTMWRLPEPSAEEAGESRATDLAPEG